MQVKYRTAVAGDRFTRKPGDVVTVDDAKGKRLIQAGFVERVAGVSAGSPPSEVVKPKRGRKPKSETPAESESLPNLPEGDNE